MLESLLNSDAPEEPEEQIEEIGVEIEELETGVATDTSDLIEKRDFKMQTLKVIRVIFNSI